MKKLSVLIFGRDLELKERLYRIILILGGIMCFVSIIECIILMDIDIILLPISIMLCVMSTALVMALKYRRFSLSASIVGLLMILGIFPMMFFYSGGIEGGATVWFSLGIIYAFIMFSGKRLAAYLVLTFASCGITYGVGYFHPEWIIPMASKKAFYLDSFYSVLIVGIIIGVIFKFQIKIYQEERAIVLAQKEELEEFGNAKEAFFANMSHEIRTPINTIGGLDDMILRETDSKEIKEYARNIQAANQMLLNLVNDVLDLTQMELKSMEIIEAPYKTEEVFESLVDMIRVLADQKGLGFYVDVDKNLPSVLSGDQKRIKQVLLNILNNAVKYTETGSVTLSAYAEEVNEDSITLKISVSDTGIGIRKEDLETLYDPFRRADRHRNHKEEGNGLGLSISKQLMDLMGGEITVDSIYTKGSVFTIILEQKIVDVTSIGVINFLESEERNDDGEEYQQLFEAPEARVLVVDDNEMNTMVIEKLLQYTKVQVDVAFSGKECLALTKQKYYHVILMDYMMSEMNGAETLKEIRRQENGLSRDSHVVLLTASTLADSRRICEQYNFDSYLEKPIVGSMLEAELLKILPEDIIEYRKETLEQKKKEVEIQRISRRKRKKICIASDCVCDLPDELLDTYEIRLMYLYIQTNEGRFADRLEIDSNSLSQYLTTDTSKAKSVSASVQEYEKFFADLLTEAEQVIYVSMAKAAGKTYGIALMAAQGFGHVQVVDSGHISGGQGLVVLYAASMARQGASVQDIIEGIHKIKGKIETSFLMPSAKIFYENGYTNEVVSKICGVFSLHPVLSMHQSRLVVSGVQTGNMENAMKHFIRYHLRKRQKINTDIVVITHVGCSVRKLEFIKAEIQKYVPFQRVIVQKGAVSNACNCGMGTIGISFYRKLEKDWEK